MRSDRWEQGLSRADVKWLSLLANKPLISLQKAARQSVIHGYHLGEVWACPRIRGQAYEVRLTSDFPQTRHVVLSLVKIGTKGIIRTKTVGRIEEAFAQAIAWLDELEKG